MRFYFNNKGFSLVEILIAVVITSVVLGAVLITYTSSLRVFRDVKSISDNIETKTPSLELISRYFDRWGAGVVAQDRKQLCTNCPTKQKAINITTTNDCSDITFYGNLYGFGFVKAVSGGNAQLISCRLDMSTGHNCYTLWRNNTPLNNPTTAAGNLVPLTLTGLSTNNADCSAITHATTFNATVSVTMGALVATPGDIIYRAPHLIRLYCANNGSDGGRKWLYVDLTDVFCSTGVNELATPIAPVNAFTATAIPESPLPAGTTCAAGSGGSGCGAVQIDITFRSHTPNYQGQFDTYTVTRVFGR